MFGINFAISEEHSIRVLAKVILLHTCLEKDSQNVGEDIDVFIYLEVLILMMVPL